MWLLLCYMCPSLVQVLTYQVEKEETSKKRETITRQQCITLCAEDTILIFDLK